MNEWNDIFGSHHPIVEEPKEKKSRMSVFLDNTIDFFEMNKKAMKQNIIIAAVSIGSSVALVKCVADETTQPVPYQYQHNTTKQQPEKKDFWDWLNDLNP